MKTKIFLIYCLAICFSVKIFGQIIFQKTYNQTTYDYGHSIKQTSDGGYIIAGSNGLTFPIGTKDIYLIKTNSNGNILWTRTYGGSGDDEAFSVQQTFDGGYIVAGYTKSFGLTNPQVYILKTNANGTLDWSKILYGANSGSDLGYNSIQQTLDSCYIITSGDYNTSLFKINNNGNLLWSKVYSNNLSTYSNNFSVHQTFDKGYVLAGGTWIGSNNNIKINLIKTDSLGNAIWSKAYGDSIYDGGQVIKQTTDGGYIIGATRNFDFYIIKTDSNGDTIWSKTYDAGYMDIFYSLEQTYDGGYILAGMTNANTTNNQTAYLIKINSNGDTLWTKCFGGADVDYAYSVRQTSDSGFVMVGKTISFGNYWDVYLIKTDANGNSGGCNEIIASTIVNSKLTVVLSTTTTGTPAGSVGFASTNIISGTTTLDSLCVFTTNNNELVANEKLLTIYPNPTNSVINILLPAPESISYTIYNSIGQIIFKMKINEKQLKTEIDFSHYKAGFYFLSVTGSDWIKNEKVIKN